MTQPDIEELLRQNIALSGDGNIIGTNNQTMVIKQSTGNYIIQIDELHVTCSEDKLRCLVAPPIPPEAEGEVLILIATFHHANGVVDTEPHHKIRRAIETARADVSFANLRVAVNPTSLLADDRAGAQALADRCDASLVIWGEDSGVEVLVSFYNRKHPDFNAAQITLQETSRTQLSTPSEYVTFITQDLPAQLTFLAFFALGQSYTAQKDYIQGTQILEAAFACLERPTIIIGAASAYFLLGWLYDGPLADKAKALSCYTHALDLDSQFALAYNNRGVIYTGMHNYDRALTDSTRALDLDPQYALAYYNRGNIYYGMHDYSRALADFTHALDLDPQDIDAYVSRGNTYYKMRDYNRAIADLTRALDLNPQDAHAYNNRGNIYYKTHNYDRALADYICALDIDSQYATAYYNRGNTYTLMGKYDQALADYTRAIDLEPQNNRTHISRGLTYICVYKYAKALSDFAYLLRFKKEKP